MKIFFQFFGGTQFYSNLTLKVILRWFFGPLVLLRWYNIIYLHQSLHIVVDIAKKSFDRREYNATMNIFVFKSGHLKITIKFAVFFLHFSEIFAIFDDFPPESWSKLSTTLCFEKIINHCKKKVWINGLLLNQKCSWRNCRL